MKALSYTILFFVCLFWLVDSQAQDARFTQFYTAPMQSNPAFTGAFTGQMRGTVNYRNQWSSVLSRSAFNTLGASFDIRIPTTNPYDRFAGGINLIRDNAGDSRFSQTRANLSASYLKTLSASRYSANSNTIAVGFQAGIGQHGVDWSRLNFSTQFDNTSETFVPTNPNGEATNNNNSQLYFDMNAGVAWLATFDDNLSVYAGAAVQHLLQPNVSFLDGTEESLYRRYIIQAGGQVPFTDRLSILPAILMTSQGPAQETVIGANVRYANDSDYNEIALRFGGWFRIVGDNYSSIKGEAFAITSMLEYSQFLFGVSYDVNVSSLQKATNTRGAVEISLTYITEEQTRYKVACPRF